MKIELNGELIKVLIIKKSIKNMYFRFDDDLNLVITCNKWVSDLDIKRVIKEKSSAILNMYYHKLKELDNNAYFTYLGNNYNVIYDEKVKSVSLESDNIITKDDKMLDKFYFKKCKEVFLVEIEKIKPLFNNLPNFDLRVRKMKTRWGVCNVRDKVITLNSELLKKEITLIDYVIIHEMCHFYHPNHSASFWNLVSKYYPYYKNARKMLKNV